MALLKNLFYEGIAHRGFSFIDVLQICATFFPLADYYTPRVYELAGHDPSGFEAACAKVREWDYNTDAPIALGTFFKRAIPTFDEKMKGKEIDPGGRERAILAHLASRM
jgi:2-oxoglutarate ferredoxin oxidoreductase subunit beta